MKIKILLPILLVIGSHCFAEKTIEVFQSNMKITGMGEEKMYFGFSAGDKIVFNFQELDRKELKEVEIFEYPGNSKFMDYKTKAIVNKTIEVQTTGIFCFRFTNGALTGRICSIKIDRIPKDSSTFTFNTNVFWKTVQDTSFHAVQEQYIVKSDTICTDFYSSTPQISSQNALNGNRPYQVLNFDLPKNTVAWSFYIGTGNEGRAAYENSRTAFLNTAASVAATIPGYGLMAELALHGVNYMNKVQGADNVKYYFLSSAEDVQKYYANQPCTEYKRGDVINEACQMKRPLFGPIYLLLYNDNTVDPIVVTVKATAIVVNNTYDTRMKQVMNIAERSVPYLNN